MIDYSFLGVRHAKALLAAIAECGVTPPKTLTGLVAGFDELKSVSTQTNAVDELVKKLASGKPMSTAERDKAIEAAWAAHEIGQFRFNICQRVEPALLRQFGQALEDGAADDIIASLTPQFDAAARALERCAELIDPNVAAETFIAQADEESLAAWRSIDEHITTLTNISNVVCQFGPMSTSFKMVDLPSNVLGTERLDNRALMCVSPRFGVDQACSAFLSVHGTHRHSVWFKVATALQLCTIAEAREKVRAFAESAWAALNINQGRGRMDPKKGFIAEPVPNPYALAQVQP